MRLGAWNGNAIVLAILNELHSRGANGDFVVGSKGFIVDFLPVNPRPVRSLKIIKGEFAVRFQLHSRVAPRYQSIMIEDEVITGARRPPDHESALVDRYI